MAPCAVLYGRESPPGIDDVAQGDHAVAAPSDQLTSALTVDEAMAGIHTAQNERTCHERQTSDFAV